MSAAEPERARFDKAAFDATLDATRAARGLTWRDVAREAGVSPSTLTRLGQGKNPDVHTFAALVAWSGADAGQFVGRPVETPEPLAVLLARFRRHSGLSPRAASLLEKTVLTMYEALREDPPGHEGAGT